MQSANNDTNDQQLSVTTNLKIRKRKERKQQTVDDADLNFKQVSFGLLRGLMAARH